MGGSLSGQFPSPNTAAGALLPPDASPRLRLVLIGRMEAWSLASVSVLPRSRKTRALLAILALAAGEPVPRARLADLLWSRRGEDQQRGSLRQAVRELTEALAPVGPPLLLPTRDSVALRPGLVWTDAVEVLRASAGQPEALSLLTGVLLADLDGLDEALDGWLAGQRRRLQDAAAACAAGLLARAGDPRAAVAAARRLIEIEPTHEGAWRALIRAQSELGDRGAALSAYERCRDLLTTRFGVAPSPETENLAHALRAGGAVPIAEQPGSAPDGTPSRAPRLATRGARLGVLPLRTLGDQTEPHLAAGLAEEIATSLARFRWLFVADSASLAAAVAQRGEAAAAQELGLDFLLSGTVQRAGARVRVTLQLTDLRPPATIVWSQRFESESDDMLALQDQTAAELVARIDPEILLIEAERAATRRSIGATGYDLLLRAIPALHRLDPDDFLEAGRLLARATALEPDYAPAFAWHAYWHLFLVGQGWARDQQSFAEAERLAQRAVALDPQDAHALTIYGHVRAFLHHALREARGLHERALALNPNLAMAWVFAGMTESYIGEHRQALERLDRYKQLSPLHPHAFFFDAARGIPLLLLRRHEDAAEVGRAAISLRPGMSYPYKFTLSALGHLGATAEAAALRARLATIEPDFSLDRATHRNPMALADDRAHYEAGLRLAGVV
ncbi:MAG TPA: BTAD domain-containing putative transcriptional regulator [Falsiroseomonas sp.]|jgi:DNA-binding SARP family transcriptional activator|nr:BTAD domain-containing putative transcriptional regulator [Falsiroseomonas sp.]